MAEQQQLTKEMMEAVDNYGSRIKTLKDFQTSIRTRSGMYLGALQNKGMETEIREIFQNSVDQILDPSSPADWVSLFIDTRNYRVEVMDNGLSLPYTEIIRIFTTAHTSKNFEVRAGEYSAGVNGVGAKVVNALSEYMIVEAYHYDGTAVKIRFEKGYPTTKAPVKIPNKNKFQGTKIEFVPDLDILQEVTLDWEPIYRLARNIMSMTPIGSKMDFKAIDKAGNVHTERFINKDGIITDLIAKVKRAMIKPVVGGADNGRCKVDFAFCYDAGDEKEGPGIENVTSFSNFCPTRTGTHVDGVLDGIGKWFVKYMNNIYLAAQNKNTKKPTKVTSQDTRVGLNIMISAAHLEPQWTGQVKDILSNPDMLPFCSETAMNVLDEWAKANPQDLAKICKYLKDVADQRIKDSTERAKIVSKYTANVFGMPSKYRKPSKQKKEFIIVEGDSAANSVYNGRDAQTQGYFPIRGKMPNAFRTARNKFLENEEVQGIIKIILNKDPRDVPKKGAIPFDPEKDVPWEKIILMADADVDTKSRYITTNVLVLSKDAFRNTMRVI